MVADKLQKKILEAMKAKDEIRVSTLKLLSSAFHYQEIKKRDMTSDDNKSGTLTDEEELKIIRSQIKKRKDAIELYEQGGAKEKAEREKKELEILKEFLPEEMSDEELEKIVDRAIEKTGAKEMRDMGRVIGMVMGQVKGKVEGGRVSEFVKNKLSS